MFQKADYYKTSVTGFQFSCEQSFLLISATLPPPPATKAKWGWGGVQRNGLILIKNREQTYPGALSHVTTDVKLTMSKACLNSKQMWEPNLYH